MPHRKPAAEIVSPALGFDGGFNYLDQSQVKPNQLVAGRNWWRDLDGVVRPRPGNRVWNAVSLGADFQGLWEYRRQSDQVNRLMAYAGGTLFKGDDTSKSFALLLTNLDTGAIGWAANAQDDWWFCNGVQTPRVYEDATNLFRIGVVPPSTAPAVALVALAGNLPAEDHYYRYTYVREDGGTVVRESNPSPESAKVTNDAAHAQNDITVVASTDAQVTHIYIYRRSSTSVPEFKFVGKTTNVGGTFRDNVAASGLGAFAFWEPSGGEEDHGYPPDDLFGMLPEPHRDGRLYAWGPQSRLYYTRVNQFHYWPGAGAVGTRTGFQIVVGADDGDEGQALLSEGDDLWALKRRNVYRLLGDGPSTDDGLPGSWKIEKVPTPYGCAARASASVGPAGAFWLSDWGPVRVDTRSGLPRLIGLELRPWLETATDLTKARGCVWGWYYLLFIPVAGGKWEGHAFDARTSTWWPLFDMDVTALTVREDGTLVWGGILEVDKPANGVVYEFNKQVSDNGRAVTAELLTRVIDVRVGWWKLLRKTLIACEGNPAAKLTARIIPDQSQSYVERELKLNSVSGARMLKPFTGTKRLQGWAFQLYLKSENLTKRRPAIYYWQQLIHTLNRELLHTPAFTVSYPDPDPTVPIIEGDWGAGTHTDTRVVNGKVALDEDFTWVLALGTAYDFASSLVVFQGKLVGVAHKNDNTMRALIFDGGSWSDVAVGLPYEITGVRRSLHLLPLGASLFAGGGMISTVAYIKKTQDLSTWSDYGTTQFYQGRPTLHAGLLWVVALPRTSSVYYDAGGGAMFEITSPPVSDVWTNGESFRGELYVSQVGGTLYSWNGTSWTLRTDALPSAALALRRFSINDRLYVGCNNGEVMEWDGATLAMRIGPVAGGVYDIVEVVEPDGRHALYACREKAIQRSYDGTAWTNLGVLPSNILGAQVYKGRRFAALDTGDIYASAFFKTFGTYRLDERDLGAVKTSAEVTIAASVPSGAALRTRIGYALAPGGPYTFTAWHTQLAYTETVNGRYIIVEFEFTGDGTVTAEVDELEIIFR